jgi:hypothetical protein
MDMLFTFDDMYNGSNSEWFRHNTFALFNGTNVYPFKIVNVTFNPNPTLFTVSRQEEFERLLRFDWADSFNPFLAINCETNEYLLCPPYALMMFPKYFENWIIVPTNFYCSHSIVLEYYNLKDLIKCKTIGELMLDSYIVNYQEDYDSALIRQHNRRLDQARRINLGSQSNPNPYIREFTLTRRKTMQFVKQLFNPEKNNPTIPNQELIYQWANSSKADFENELDLFEHIWLPILPKLELFEEKIRDSNLLFHLNQAMNTQHKLKHLEL